jgi:hypothetical protein
MVNDQACPSKQGNPPHATVDIGLYTKIPSKFFSSGTASKLGPSPSLLFLALCEHANRNSSISFKASDAALASDTGLGTRTIFKARQRLVEFNLICCDRQNGRSYVYTLKEYQFNWKPLKERPRVKRKPRAEHASRIAVQQTLRGSQLE